MRKLKVPASALLILNRSWVLFEKHERNSVKAFVVRIAWGLKGSMIRIIRLVLLVWFGLVVSCAAAFCADGAQAVSLDFQRLQQDSKLLKFCFRPAVPQVLRVRLRHAARSSQELRQVSQPSDKVAKLNLRTMLLCLGRREFTSKEKVIPC